MPRLKQPQTEQEMYVGAPKASRYPKEDPEVPSTNPARKVVKLVLDEEYPRIETEDTASIPPQKRREQQGEVL